MNTRFPMAATAMLLVGMATASAVRAFDVAGTLGVNQNAVDVFTINCLSGINGTNSAKVWVWDVVHPAPVNNTAKMRVFLVEFPNPLSPPGRRRNPRRYRRRRWISPENERGDGAGLYQVHFLKTASGEEATPAGSDALTLAAATSQEWLLLNRLSSSKSTESAWVSRVPSGPKACYALLTRRHLEETKSNRIVFRHEPLASLTVGVTVHEDENDESFRCGGSSLPRNGRRISRPSHYHRRIVRRGGDGHRRLYFQVLCARCQRPSQR